MSGIVGAKGRTGEVEGVVFKASINDPSLPTITTASVPVGRTWIAHGVCKLVEAATMAIGAVQAEAVAQATTSERFATEGGADSGTSGGTEGAADSGTSGGIFCNHGGAYWRAQGCAQYCAHYCARYCAHYCAHYCARYCGLGGYGY